MKRIFLVVLATFLTFGAAHAQVGKLGEKLKKGLNALTEEVEKNTSSQSQSTGHSSAQTAVQNTAQSAMQTAKADQS